MAISSTNYADFSYIEEVTAGTTPATPDFQRLPVTSIGLGDSISTEQSKVIRSDRRTDDLVIVDTEIGGDNDFELSYAPFKPLLVSLMQAGTPVSVNMTGSTFAVASSTITDTANGFISAGIVVGMFIKVSGFTGNVANNRIYRVTSVAAGTIGVYPTPAANDAAGETVTIKSEMIRDGASAPKSYTFRKQVNAPGGTNAIFYYRGCQINSMSFNFETGALLAGSMNIVGLSAEGTGTAIAGESFTDVPAYDIMNSVSSIAEIDFEGLPAGTEFSSLNLTVNNQIAQAKAIGTLGAAALASFSWDIAGDFEIYFQDTAIYNLYKNSSSFKVAITLQDTSGNIMVIYLPKAKFETMSEPVDGKDNFLMESGSLRALRDSITNMMAQICFFPAS
jgi:hypothetical protein